MIKTPQKLDFFLSNFWGAVHIMRFYDFENFLSVFLTSDIFVTFLFSNVYF